MNINQTITCYQAARSNPPSPPHNAALSRRRSKNKPPHDYKATPAENNPPPPTNRVIVSTYSFLTSGTLYRKYMAIILILKNDTKVSIQNVMYSSPTAEVLHTRKRANEGKARMYRPGRVRRFAEG